MKEQIIELVNDIIHNVSVGEMERVEHKNNELIVVYQKDIKNKDGSISQIVPISVIQGL